MSSEQYVSKARSLHILECCIAHQYLYHFAFLCALFTFPIQPDTLGLCSGVFGRLLQRRVFFLADERLHLGSYLLALLFHPLLENGPFRNVFSETVSARASTDPSFSFVAVLVSPSRRRQK